MQQIKFTYVHSVVVVIVSNAADHQFVAFIYKRTVEQGVIEGLLGFLLLHTSSSHAGGTKRTHLEASRHYSNSHLNT